MACTDDGALYSGTRKRTFNLLVNTALALFEQGAMPSVSELAAEAGVSRATAYRYFPTQSDLIAATVDASLGPILTWRSDSPETRDRMEQLLAFAYPQMFRHEGALRAALYVSLQQWAQDRSASAKSQTNDEKKLVRGHRKAILANVTEPLKAHVDQETLDKVIRAFSLVYGSEVFLVMKDIWKMNDGEVIDITQWMAKAILNQAMADSRAQQDEQP
ncbi:TetR/AcrR family transcriptional regulator [Morganella morganii]|mgnify:FL=1|uniref:Transcriptional regulator, TetR family n=1 Tax=Morganella morganii subsp. morganii KT TaxID=1124991 RepID=M1SJN6_MORMO|nr:MULTISPECIES: TetR/AcrR family transcriptional regulator [Morganella]AGG30151.1 Transcriptional regulator, TetR family [Morganella morganii subsp. morganii KT]AMG68963.1 TetR/AcrR family transcriptional regulator [Morganella morganii]AZP26728.1 TetR/AcrR family transcriptional regulator [Morganella morganii]EJK8623870.1 TetR/AcrR family transcriptional regulator [Morganella morganii]EKU4285878.1 TetR/AcrR family transcriptional regulator [Morganella morganii]